MPLRLRLFGSPAATGSDGQPVAGLGPGKPLALLAYLTRNPEARRDELAALLWGDVDEARARNAFRQSLHRLRGALDGMLVQSRDRLSLRRGEGLWIDVAEFEAALEAGRIEDALELYRGEFLEGFSLDEPSFDHWADRERGLLRGRFEAAAEAFVRQALAEGRSAQAVRWTERLAEIAPYEAEPALLRATALVSGGRRAEAAAFLRSFVDRLREELGLPPPREIEDALAKLGGAPPVEAADGARAGAPLPAAATISPLVGRSDELARLLGAWQEAKRGVGQLLVVEGDPGSGKSRLLDEFAAGIGALDDALVLRGNEPPSGPKLAYAPIAQALRGALRAPGLAGASDHLLAEAARLLPELRDRFRLPAPGPIEDQAARLRFFEGVATFVEAVAYENPVCLLLDDVHRSAAATRELVAYLAARLAGSATLIVVTRDPALQRADESAPELDAETLTLAPLDAQQAEELVNAHLGADQLPPDEIERVVAFAAGNPLRLLTLAKAARAGEALSAPLVGMRDILWTRLESRPPTHRRLFLATVLLGRPAPLRVLAAAAHLSEPATLDAALELEADGLVTQTAEGIAPAHALAAELAMERAGSAGRALLAGWAAEALQAHEAGTPAELAELYARAGRGAQAHRYAWQAADDAARVGAWTEVVDYLRIAARFAPDAETRAEIETRLEAVGAGRARLLRAGPPTRGGVASKVQSVGQRWGIRSPLVVAAAAFVLLGAVALLVARDVQRRPVGHLLRDTVLLVERATPGQSIRFAATGPLAGISRTLEEIDVEPANPPWADSLNLPWINPRPSPSGAYVAVERMTATGPDLYVMTSDRRDTVLIAGGPGDDVGLGWSPDARWLLFSRSRTRPDDSYDTDLYAYHLESGVEMPLDTLASHEIVDAYWSPDGAHIAWTARVGAEDQQEIFVSRADGADARNISAHAAEDYHPAWGPDGTRIAFTTERDGNAEIYSAEIPSGQLARITFDVAQDDRAAFSPDNRFVAFESTRGGELAVFVAASRGGQAARVSPPNRRMGFGGWRGAPVPYVDQVRLASAVRLPPGDSTIAQAEALRSDGSRIALQQLVWRSLDPALLRVTPLASGEARLVGLREGLARIVLGVNGWRTDTATLKVGGGPVLMMRDEFEAATLAGEWVPYGPNPPRQRAGSGRGGTGGLVPQSTRGAQSGLLSAGAFPLAYGLRTRAAVRAPFAASQPASASIALVPPRMAHESARGLPDAPLAALTWIGETGRVAYSVERESRTEPVSAFGARGEHELELHVEEDGRVAFYIDGRLRWRSSLRLGEGDPAAQARVSIGGQSAGIPVAFDDVHVWVGATRSGE